MTDTGVPTPEHERFLDLARSLPKIPEDDPRVQEILTERDKEKNRELRIRYFSDFGNNFYLLFTALRARQLGDEPKFSLSLRMSDEIGEPFQQFLVENSELLVEIYAVQEEQEPFDEILRYVRDQAEVGHFDMLDELDRATGHPLGVSAIKYYFCDRLNPLMEDASMRMESVGIDPTEFYGTL